MSQTSGYAKLRAEASASGGPPFWACAPQPSFVPQFFCSFFQRKSQRRPRGENDREAAARLAERSQKTTLFCTIVPGARCAPASSSDIFTSRKQADRRPAEKYKNTRSHNPAKRTILTSDTVSLRRPSACTIALRKARKKWRRRRERPKRVCERRPQASAEAACGLCRAATVEAARLFAPQTAQSFVPAQRATATTPAAFRRA